jgi:3-hydroxyacyl-[acyl-carrier-protein] dehydratase
MLEAATQAGAWLIRLSENYAHSIIVLHEARAVKYADFVAPGHTLTIRVEQTKKDDRYTNFRFQGTVEGRVSVSGRLVLERLNISDTNPDKGDIDARMIEYQRGTEKLLTRGIETPAAIN